MKRASRIALEAPRPSARPSGRTFVVTGAASGLGRGAAGMLAAMGARVVGLVRTDEQVHEVRATLAGRAARGRVDVLAGDLGSREDVERLAAEVVDHAPEIHGLLHCAGLRLPERRLGPDGTERMFAVEYLAPFLLTHRLMGALEAGVPSRIIVVSGEAHRKGPGAPRALDLGNLQAERTFGPREHGKHLALARILFVQELGRRTRERGVGALAVSPGPTRTGLLRHIRGLPGLVERALLQLQRPQAAEAGAAHVVHAAIDPELEDVYGRYVLRGREVVPSPGARDPAAAKALWEATETLLGERFLPGAADVS